MRVVTVDSKNLKENYNSVVEGLAQDAFKLVLDYFERLTDEKGSKVSLYFEDICNMVTHAAQAARRDFVVKSNESAPVTAPKA